mgnify:CR=1 FL=1
MSDWEKKRVLVTVKAYPERSKKYGTSVCTAGITDEGEWIRLYPITLNSFIGQDKISKYYWIEVECRKDTKEKLQRKESHKVREQSIKILDTSLSRPKADWGGRSEVILPTLAGSMEELAERFKEDKTSLGLIKPKEVLDFYTTQDFELVQSNKEYIKTLTGELMPVTDEIPHMFKYKFTCEGCQPGKEHNIQCEDWELFESYRAWGKYYHNDPEITWEKMREKYYTWMMEKRDLYFMVGTESQFGRWLIIGVYYPPKPGEEDIDPAATTLDQFGGG